MTFFNKEKKYCLLTKVVSVWVMLTFVISTCISPSFAETLLNLPEVGSKVYTSNAYQAPITRGIQFHSDNPLKFDFIIEQGEKHLSEQEFHKESERLIKYFLASLTVPEKQMWVNLSPYEADRIIPSTFGKTKMGRDLLAQDYLLKQLSSSLMDPNDPIGEKFWKEVYAVAEKQWGVVDVALNSFNKIWIVPEKAVLYEYSEGAFIVESKLKVMLEEDYLALEENNNRHDHGVGKIPEDGKKYLTNVSNDIVRRTLLPVIEKEVNEGATFSNLRQIYHAMLLATWYKQRLKEGVLGSIYVDRGKVRGIDITDQNINQKIYDRYVAAFHKGVFDFIREDYDEVNNRIVPRKYFAGGADITDKAMTVDSDRDLAMKSSAELKNPRRVTWQAKFHRRDVFKLLGLAALGATIPNWVMAQVPELKLPNRTLDVPKTITWMEKQIHPQTLLVNSYTGLPANDVSKDVTWLYNQGQIIQAFLALNNQGVADNLVKGVLKLPKNGKAWFNGYFTQTGTVADKLADQRLSSMGANMALGHGLLSVLEKTDDSDLAKEILKQAIDLADWVKANYVDKGDYGFIRGGEGKKEILTEYNARAFAYLYQLYRQFNDPSHKHKAIFESYRARVNSGEYKSIADKVIVWIQTRMFQGDHYAAGYSDADTEELMVRRQALPWGHRDFWSKMPRYWGYSQYILPIMASIAGLNPQDFGKGMDWLLKNQVEVEVEGKKYKGFPRLLGSSSIWGKGTSEAVVALQLLGRHEEARPFLETLAVMQDESGGIKAAIGGVQEGWPYHFPFPSVEATSPVLVAARDYGATYIADIQLTRNRTTRDAAMVADQVVNEFQDVEGVWKKGGIDFNPAIVDMDIRSDGVGVDIPVGGEIFTNFEFEGLLPTIINTRPITHLPLSFE